MAGQPEKEYKTGDKVWGCTSYTSMTCLKPVPGTLEPARDGSGPAFFVPADGSGKYLLGACSIAGTQEECTHIYNVSIMAHIKELQEDIMKAEQELVPVLDMSKDEDGFLEKEPVWRRDVSFNYDAIFGYMTQDLEPRDGCDGDRMPWEEFVECVELGGFTDNDGFGDLLIDGMASSNVALYLAGRYVYVYDEYQVPFERVTEVFAGHKLEVLWFNK